MIALLQYPEKFQESTSSGKFISKVFVHVKTSKYLFRQFVFMSVHCSPWRELNCILYQATNDLRSEFGMVDMGRGSTQYT